MLLPALTPALKLLVPAEAVIISAPSAYVTSAAKLTAPSTSTMSRLAVPSTSMSPDISNVAASSSPVKVIFLNEPMSLLLSTTTPRLAATVPAVTPSRTLSSAGVEVIAVVVTAAKTGTYPP